MRSNKPMPYLPTPQVISDKFVEQAWTRVDMKRQGFKSGSASVSVPTRLESSHTVSSSPRLHFRGNGLPFMMGSPNLCRFLYNGFDYGLQDRVKLAASESMPKSYS